MRDRVLVLLRAHLAGQDGTANLPVAPLLFHGVVAAALAWLARDSLPPLGYGIYVLSVSAILVAMPLLGEFGHLLRREAAEEWVAALPLTGGDVRLARALHVLIVLVWLSLGSLLPAVALAPRGPEGLGLLGHLALGLGGVALVTAVGSGLLVLQARLGARAEPILVTVQTVLFAGAVVGFVLGRDLFPALREVRAVGDARWTWFWPPAWFAAPLGQGSAALVLLPIAIWGLALAALLGTRPAPSATSGRREPILARVLRPVRTLATRTWVRRDERAVFDLIYDALPLEREVVLRTYPMVAIPLAFVVAASVGEGGRAGSDLIAVLMFTACIYLPVLLLHVPASASYRASWILATRPLSAGAVIGGGIKAVALRFLVPLYALLAALAWIQGGFELIPRLALPGFLISLWVTRLLYPTCVTDLPLSVPPDRVQAKYDWGGAFLGIALLLTVLAMVVNRKVTGAAQTAALVALLVALEWAGERRLRRRLG